MGFQETFKAMSDTTRRDILSLLKNGKRSAGDISKEFNMTGATVSHHLSILKNANLITDEKKGKYIFYELNTSVLEEVIHWMLQFRSDENEKS